MSDEQDTRDRMLALLSRCCDGAATPDERAEVNRLLRAERAALAAYLHYMDLHANLSADAPVTDAVDTPGAAATAATAGRIGGSVRRSWAIAAAVCVAGAAAAIVAWALVAPGIGRPTQVAERKVVGVLLAAADAEWGAAPGQALPADGESLVAGRYELRSGSAVVELMSGVTVTMDGPATLTLQTPQRSYLAHGRLTAVVPHGAHGYTVDTPTMSVVDLGTEFAVAVDEGGDTRVSVYVGEIEVAALSEGRGRIGPTVPMSVGQTARVSAEDRRVVLGAASEADLAAGRAFDGPIALGNLFDDAKDAPLAAAMASDGFAAMADAGDLGVAKTQQGGDAIVEIGGGVRFDLRPLGWSDHEWGSIANDAWTGEAGRSNEPIAGIRTKGESIGAGFSREEDGVGMHANAVVVFDLDALRKAGRLIGRSMRLVVDRAGINDESFGAGSVRLAVLVADDRGVMGGYVNGKRYEARLGDDEVWRLAGERADVLSGDGRFASFDVPVPAGARYLALIAAAAEDVSGGTGRDHAVFSGARLEIDP